jgi:FAD/FMN-containing dehydrogenase
MGDLRVARLTGPEITLPEPVVREFQKSLQGELICPGDGGYDEARKIWNANIDKHPALIARCMGVTDVMTAVNFARDNEVLVSVRGGGHNFFGTCIAERGMVIDLSLMNSVRVDPARRIARAEGGTTWGQFDLKTQAFCLACTGGTDANVGIAGLTLGGGHGWLGGKYGLALDNLLSVDIITADGKLCIASATENPDLFWAVRGGGGNFGVVTSFEYQLYPVWFLLVGLAIFPLDQARKVLRFYHEFASTAPDELNTVSGLATLKDGTPAVGIIACYNGPLAEGEKVMQGLRKLGQPITSQFSSLPYLHAQHLLDTFVPEGNQYYAKAHFVTDISDDVINLLVDAYSRTSSPGNVLSFQQQGNAANRVPQDTTAYSHRDARYDLTVIANWSDPEESERHVQWTEDLWEALTPYCTGGVYVNALGTETDHDATLIRSAYGANYPRLAKIKNKYDPDNLFRHNQNIRPMA